MAGKLFNFHSVTTVIYLALILTTSNYKWTRLPIHWEASQHHGTFSFDGQPEKEIECVDVINYTEKISHSPLCSRNFQNVKLCSTIKKITICLMLRFYVKSNFSEFQMVKIVIFGNFRGSEFGC